MDLSQFESALDCSHYLDAHVLSQSLPPLERWRSPRQWLLVCRFTYQAGDIRSARIRAYLGQKRYPDDIGLANFWSFSLEEHQGSYRALAYLNTRDAHKHPDTSTADLADNLSRRAVLLASLKDETAAMDLVQQARELMPDDPWHIVSESRVLRSGDKYQAAMLTARRAYKLHSSNRIVIQNLADTLLLLGQRDQALALMKDHASAFQSWVYSSQLADLALEADDPMLAEAVLADGRRFAPLMSEQLDRHFMTREVEVDCRLGRTSEAAAKSRLLKGEYYRQLAQRLDNTDMSPAAARSILPVAFIRQHHNTCGPAVLSSLTGYWGRPCPMDQIVDAIWYGGTFDHQERSWLEAHGWLVREFRLDWDTACALIDRKVPFALATMTAGNGHLQAIIGVDRLQESLIIRDPYDPLKNEVLQEPFFEHQSAFGPRAMLLLPEDKRTLLDGLPLKEAAEYDLYYRFSLALNRHDRDGTRESLKALEDSGNQRLALLARRRLAAYDANDPAMLQCVERLLEHYPKDATLLLDKQRSLRSQGLTKARIEWLREQVALPDCDPALQLALASALMDNIHYRGEARQLLRASQRLLARDADWHATRADLAWRERDFDRSLEHYRLACCLAPTRENYVRSYISASRIRNRLAEALAYLRRRFQKLGTYDAAPGIALAQALDETNRSDLSVTILTAVHKQHPSDGDLLLYTAGYLQDIGRLTDAKPLLERAEAHVRRPDWLRSCARQAEMEGDRQRAASLYADLVELDITDMQAQRFLAAREEETRGTRQAVDYLLAQVEASRGFPPLIELCVEYLADAGRTEEACNLLKQRLLAAPQDISAIRELARLTAFTGDNAQALRSAEQAITLDPNDAANHEIAGWIARRLGDAAMARASYERALKLDVDREFALREIMQAAESRRDRVDTARMLVAEFRDQVITGEGLLCFQQEGRATLGDDVLLDQLKEAHAARPDLWQTWSALISQFLDMDRMVAARRQATRMVEQFPSLPRAQMELARVCREANDQAGEVTALNKARALSPHWTEPVHRLADLAEQRGDWPEYRKLIEGLLARNPSHAGSWGFISSAQEHDGDTAAAIASLEKAVSLDRNYEWAWEQLDRLYSAQGSPRRLQQRLLDDCERYPGEVGVHHRAARFSDDDEERLGLLLHARDLDALNQECHFQAIRQLIRMGRYEEATKAIDHPVWRGSVPPELKLLCAEILREQGQSGASRRRLKELLRYESDLGGGWKTLLAWTEIDDDREGYRYALDALTKLYPSEPSYKARLAETLIEDQHYDEADILLRTGFQAHPNDSYTALTYLDYLLDRGEFQEAENVFQECVRRFPAAVTYARGVRLYTQTNNDKQARSWFDRVLAEQAPGEWALDQSLRWLKISHLPGKLLNRLRTELLATEGGHFEPDLLSTWAKLALDTLTEEQVIKNLRHLDGIAADRVALLSVVLNALGEHTHIKEKLLKQILRDYSAEISNDDNVWADACWCLHNQHMEEQAIALGSNWQARDKAPVHGFFFLASSYGTKNRWAECLEIAEQTVSRSPDKAAPSLHLTLAAYGYALGREDLFDRYYPRLDPEQLDDHPYYLLCQCTHQWRHDGGSGETVDIKRYVEMAKSYQTVNRAAGIRIPNLIQGHLVQTAKDRSLKPLAKWLNDLKHKQLVRRGCLVAE